MSDDRGLLASLLDASHLVVPDQVPALIDQHAHDIGARSAVVYLIDLDQHWLIPLPWEGGPVLAEVAVDRTIAGRAFRSMAILDVADEGGGTVVWVPIVDGTERLGVLQVDLPSGVQIDADQLRAFSGLVAEMVLTKGAYGDFFEFARRRRPLTVAAELLWQLLPPLTFGTDELVITAGFVPTSDLGGDAFDYGVDTARAQVAIFDGMGHGLAGGLLTTGAVAAYRNARRSALDLPEAAARVGQTIRAHYGASRFVTGLLTSLDIGSGRFSWCVAGHPAPLLVRQGRIVKDLGHSTGQPFGIGPASEVFHERLEAGDRVLLYTDGVTEARTASGELFGVEQLVDLISRTAGDDPPPEAMRRLMHAIEEHNDGPMRDDATVVMIEWRGTHGGRLTP